MTAADIVIDHGNSAWDNWKLIIIGITLSLGVAVLLWVANAWSDAFWGGVFEKRKADAQASTKTRTYADTWSGTREGVARAQAAIDAGECRITIAALHRKPKHPTRLTDFRATHGKKRAS